MGGQRLSMLRVSALLCTIAICVAISMLHAADCSEESEPLDVRLTRFHSCLHQAESANHCMHLRPDELDDHVDDDLDEMAHEAADDDDGYGIGESDESETGRGGGFLAVGGSMSLGGGSNGSREEEDY